MENVCIPMHLDAFALSEKCFDKTLHSKIAPFVQPNYTALRLDSHIIQHDVLDHVEFHTASPASSNPRVADIGAPPGNNIKPNRLGIHLHWSLPKFYRAAKSSARKSAQSTDANKDATQPLFRKVPNRWLITRHLKNFKDSNVLKEFQSWVVESDAVQYIKAIPDDVDLESDVSPFVSYKGDPNQDDILKSQTEVFLGQKFDLASWRESSAGDCLRDGLTVMSSSNPLFPDYALHNTNVFSIIDSFRYKTKATDPDYKYLDNARCDYFVIGWHSVETDDPMNEKAPTDPNKYDLNTRLSDLNMQLNSDRSKDQGKATGTTRCLVFGSIFDVVYNSGSMPRSLAEEAAAKFLPESIGGFKMEPLSVGTTPLDGILTFLEAHEQNADKFFGNDTNTIADYILDLSQLLYASSDQYDARVQAQDLIAQQNFAKADGGLQWTFNDKSGGQKPKVPDSDTVSKLRILNEQQIRLDSMNRKLKTKRWDLFAEWWKFSSEYLPPKDPARKTRIDQYKAEVGSIKESIQGDSIKKKSGLVDQRTKLEGDTKPDQIACKNSARDAYFQRVDPTLCIAGLDSGWPSNLNDNLTVVLEEELGDDTAFAKSVFDGLHNPVPDLHGLQTTAGKLLSSCQRNATTNNGLAGPPSIQGTQAWGARNPFIPMFIEWESIYYHIDKDSWEVALRPSPFGHPTPQIRYYIPEKKLDPGSQKDMRSISGRVLVLPQPVFNLENVIKNVINTPDADKVLKPDQKQKLLDNVRQIKFVSAPLSGLTNHLLTRYEGAHVKPTVRTQGEVVKGIAAAAKISSLISLGVDDLSLIDAESSLTPYGNLMEFNPTDYPNDPFKGVTHGQMVFTKINIVDKFGQAICLPVPTRRRVHPVQPPKSTIYPCLSHYLAPDAFDKKLNTVYPTDPVADDSWPLCPYIQLSPAINQNARINASFLVQDTTNTGAFGPWREATDYESPIWGFLVNNYADNGLQFFRGDGQFYCEIRKGGVAGTTRSATKYLPFQPPSLDPTDAGTAQLAKLLDQLSPESDPNGDYLQGFFDMINGSIHDMPFPPSSYAAYANSIVGKPLALVNVGWSIELAEEPLKQQYSLRPPASDPQKVMRSYKFPLKIGDKTRTFDGVVGYFTASNPSSNSNEQLTDFKTTYTYFNSGASSKIQTASPTDIQPTPYYTHPDLEITSDPNLIITTDMLVDRERHYSVTSVLMDPYVTIHGYSPILPTKQLTLSPWTVEEAMKRMHAFFRLGPSLMRDDVPKTLADALAIKPDGPNVKLPVSGGKGTWSWLQPYAITPPPVSPTPAKAGDTKKMATGVKTVVATPAAPAVVTTKEEDDTKYAEIPVSEDPGGIRFDNGPYTFVEGYLQLAGSLAAT